MFRKSLWAVLTLSALCLSSTTAMASNWLMVVGTTYTNGVHSLYSTNFVDRNQLTIETAGDYTITATTDNYANPPRANVRPGTRRVYTFNCHFTSIKVKALDGTVVASAIYPRRVDTDDQTESLDINLPAGDYIVETIGVVNGRATSPLGHYGKFYLTTIAR